MSNREVSHNEQEMSGSGSAPGPAATEDVSIQAENIQSDPLSAPQPFQPVETFFGLRHDPMWQGYPQPVFKDDYAARFPEDLYGQETKPNARIWRVYAEEAAAYDENMIGQSRDGLDVMLVFAGLFSAVVTSFLVQVSQNLQADFSEMSTLLLHDLIIVQLSMADGATVNVTTPSINPAEKFKPDAIDVWINGLWVVSLVTSLVVALSAVLVKQWLHRYMSFPSGTPGLRSHIRQFRYTGLEKWRVRVIIGMLPIVMHISLVLFFAGLALFYVPLHVELAWVVGTITVLVCVLYLVSNTIPIIFPQCPYQTPLTNFVHHVCQIVSFSIQSVRHYCFVAYRGIHKRPVPSQQQSSVDLGAPQSELKSLTRLEFDAVRDADAILSVDALDWLYRTSSNPTVHALVLQGISGLTPESSSYALKKWEAATDMRTERRYLVRHILPYLDFPDHAWIVERLCRSSLFLRMDDSEVVSARHIFHGLSGEWDPRIAAATSLVDMRLRLLNPHKFFIAHSELLLHPLMWQEIVHSMLLYPAQHPMGKWSLAQVLSLVIVPPLATRVRVSLITGPQAVWTLLPQFWNEILKKTLLARYDTMADAPISSYHRTLIATGKLALSNIHQDRDDTDDYVMPHHRLVELLGCVVGLLTRSPNTNFWNPFLPTTSLPEDFDFLIRVLEKFSFPSMESQSSSPLSLCLEHIRSFYLHSTLEFRFLAVNRFLRTWTDSYDCQYECVYSDYRSSKLETPIIVMGQALSRGLLKAYQTFTNGGWMGIIFSEWAICGDKAGHLCQVIRCLVRGLHAGSESKIVFRKYIHEPQHLIPAFMLMVATEDCLSPKDDIVLLATICPTHSSWRDCATALRAILAWAQTPNPEISLFPWPISLRSLETTEAFRKYPLVEWTARRFADPDVHERLKEALEALHEVLDDDVNLGRPCICHQSLEVFCQTRFRTINSA